MATRLYFHATSHGAANLPTTTKSSLSSNKNVDAVTVNRTSSTSIGAAQTSLVLSTNASASAQNYYFSRFVSSLPLDQTSVAANTWTYNFAAAENNVSANFPGSGNNKAVRITAYVWRPSNQTVVGWILDGNSAATVDEGSAGAEVAHHVTFAGSAVNNVQFGDYIIFEIWFQITQGAATAYTDTWYYDGTTANTTDNASVSNHASFIETPENLVLSATHRLATVQTLKYGLTARIPSLKTLKYALKARIPTLQTLKYALRRYVTSSKVSLQFNGLPTASGGNSIETGAVVNGFTTTLTVAAWVKVLGACEEYGAIVGNINGSNPSEFLVHPTSNVVFWQLNLTTVGAKTNTYSTTVMNDHKWHHYVGTYDGSKLSIYIDGAWKQDLAAAGGYSLVSSTTKLRIGCAGASNTHHLNGNVRLVQFHNVVLNDSEITDLYNGVSVTRGITNSYRLDENAGTIAHDLVGANNASTFINSPAWTAEPLALAYALKLKVPSLRTLVYELQTIGLTRIETVKTLKYAVASRLPNQQTLKYALKQRVPSLQTLKYGLKLKVPTLVTLKYSLLKAVPTQRTTLYALRKQVSSLRTVKYAINARILAPRIIKYKLTARIVKDTILKYALVARIQTPRTLKYALLKQIPTFRTVKYALRLNVVTQKTIKYGLKARLQRVETIIYQLLVTGALSRVYAARTIKYSLTARLASPQTLKYALKKTLQSSKTLKYSLKSLLASSSVLKYALRSRAQSSKILKYSLLKSISSPRILKYSLKQQITTATILKYQLSARVQNITTIKYALRILGELQRLQTRKTIVYNLASYWKRVPKPKGTNELNTEKPDRPRFSLARLLGRQS